MGRSVAALVIGFFSVAVLSLGTDQVLHVMQVYPPWGEPMWDWRLNLPAPSAPMRHVAVLGIIGLVMSTAGAVVAIRMADLGPNWYPIALAATGFPCVWVGGLLFTGARGRRILRVDG